jgi:UDP-glucose 4-epimerase
MHSEYPTNHADRIHPTFAPANQPEHTRRMRILVTGAAGHLGEAICRTLQTKNIEYTSIDIKASAFTTHVGSITDPEFVDHVMQDVDYVLHTATLHKPHVGTHTKQDFIDVNITGTLHLLEAAARHRVKGFVYTSTTSTFGDMLTPKRGEPAIWITDETPYIPKNIYGVTKNAAEDLCRLFYRNHKLPCIVLKTSRFFPEEDDKKSVREQYDDLNIKANEYLYRRADIEDIVSAHLAAIDRITTIGFGKYVISATTPFRPAHLAVLNQDAGSVVAMLYPHQPAIYEAKGWIMLPHIDRVYVNQKAITELGWQPKYDFAYILDCLQAGKEFRSELTFLIGKKGYHSEVFEEGPYPVID